MTLLQCALLQFAPVLLTYPSSCPSAPCSLLMVRVHSEEHLDELEAEPELSAAEASAALQYCTDGHTHGGVPSHVPSAQQQRQQSAQLPSRGAAAPAHVHTVGRAMASQSEPSSATALQPEQWHPSLTQLSAEPHVEPQLGTAPDAVAPRPSAAGPSLDPSL